MTERKERTVIAAHDGRERGLDAIACARRIAEERDARLLIIHIIDRPFPFTANDPVFQHRVREELADVFRPAHEAGGPLAETRTLGSRSVVTGLANAVEDEEAETIVIGSSHHSPVGRVFYGDIAKQLSRRCDCEVVVAPVGAHAEPVAA